MRSSQFLALTAVFAFTAPSLCLVSAAEVHTVSEATTLADDGSDSKTLAEFLISTKNTYGWEPVEGTISYDFFPDGRLHIQGPDGEATMWQGRWKLKGNQLTITNSDTNKTQVVTAERKNASLLLDGKKYRRYRPAN